MNEINNQPLNKFERANLKRLEACVAPIEKKIIFKKERLKEYIRKTNEEIEELRSQISSFTNIIEELKKRDTIPPQESETMDTTEFQEATLMDEVEKIEKREVNDPVKDNEITNDDKSNENNKVKEAEEDLF